MPYRLIKLGAVFVAFLALFVLGVWLVMVEVPRFAIALSGLAVGTGLIFFIKALREKDVRK